MQAHCLFPITLTCYLSFPRCWLQIPILKKKKGWKPNLGATPVTSAASRYLKNNATTVVWLPPEVTQPQAVHKWRVPSSVLKSNTVVFWGGHEHFLLGDFLRENMWLLLRFPRQAGQEGLSTHGPHWVVQLVVHSVHKALYCTWQIITNLWKSMFVEAKGIQPRSTNNHTGLVATTTTHHRPRPPSSWFSSYVISLTA